LLEKFEGREKRKESRDARRILPRVLEGGKKKLAEKSLKIRHCESPRMRGGKGFISVGGEKGRKTGGRLRPQKIG